MLSFCKFLGSHGFDLFSLPSHGTWFFFPEKKIHKKTTKKLRGTGSGSICYGEVCPVTKRTEEQMFGEDGTSLTTFEKNNRDIRNGQTPTITR